MATDRQLAANRENAKLSTGPRTAEGKDVSSRNNTRHGLTARGLIILPGQEDAFTQLEAGLRTRLQPEGEVQELIFKRALECSWNLHRCRLAEEQLYASSQDQTLDPLLDDANSTKYERIQKYARQSESSMYKALRALGELQTEAELRHQLSPVPEKPEPEQTSNDLSEVCRFDKVLASVKRFESLIIGKSASIWKLDLDLDETPPLAA